MSYGSPTGPDRVQEYYTHIRRGRPPSPEQLEELVGRYEAIGGTTALAANTADQLEAISRALEADERQWVVASGTKHSSPSIEDAALAMVEAGAQAVVGVVLAPHFSAASVGEYHRRAAEALASRPEVSYRGVRHWHLLDELVAFHAAQVRTALAEMPRRTKVVFTAHSLPERVLVDDPYPEQLARSAAAVAALAGLPRWSGWGIAWQSAGATPEPWRGPDLLEVMSDLADTGRSEGLLVVPHGFTSEHLEVLYDIDIEALAAAERLGLELRRTAVVGDDPTVMGALARRCAAHLEAP